MEEINFVLVLFSGLIVGISPCILLMLSVFGSSFLITETKAKFFKISVGLLLGMILAYMIMSIAFLYFVSLFNFFLVFRYILAAMLACIGIWQIIECKKEQSLIFKTPERVKLVLKDFIENNSGIYAFLVGILFVFIKIPCFGGAYLALLYNLQLNPFLVFYIFLYILTMLIPIILILLLVRIGIESSKINNFRLKYRTYLRIINGAILILLAILLLFI
ncbi:MAG: cytochrome c biogenesis CcdA family protein [Promethearchaeota archaeon]